MLHIEPVDLRPFGVILPSDRVGIVMAQPYVPDSSLSSEEPYRWVEEAKPAQLAVLTETLAVARNKHHGVDKTHFTIFPEYSIPGLNGVEVVETALRCDGWPTSAVVIGGTDGLTKSEYGQLLNDRSTKDVTPQNGCENVQCDEWVNCSITWVKAADGNVHRWIQPKLHPARLELEVLHQHMFRGASVYLFEGRRNDGSNYRFATLVCFDWIARVDTRTPCQWLLLHLHERANGNILPLNWLFVIERNPKPSADSFMIAVQDFFDRSNFQNALRDYACLVFANTAGRQGPGRAEQFGASSLITSPASLFVAPGGLPTFSNGGPRFRDGCNVLHSSRLNDAFFRERGACIHSFAQINPASLPLGPAGRRPAVENAHVFPASEVSVHDYRAPGRAVPAAVKWINDELDSAAIPSGADQTNLAQQVHAAHELIVTSLRSMPSQPASQAIKLAAADAPKAQDASSNSSEDRNPDDWDSVESDALKHLVQSLDILKVGLPALTLGDVPPHATFMIQERIVDVFIIRGCTHQACFEHYKGFPRSTQRRALLVSRDEENTPWIPRFGIFLEPPIPGLDQEPKFTDPMIASVQIGYQDLLAVLRRAATPADIIGGFCA